jgi:hypothetical protein
VGRFLDHASEIFQTAVSAPEDSSAALTILIHPHGQIHVVDGADSPLDSLQAQYGCRSAFHVTRRFGRVRVEGRSGSSRCVLEDSQPRPSSPAAALGLFLDRPLYALTGALACV